MAGTSLLALIDDIASILDDVGTMSKVALEKTAGVVGDDLALNAKQIVGVQVDRELPVVWAVSKGSMINKVILVPIALAISVAAPWAVTPLLMLGGAFLCYEGCEKLFHSWLHAPSQPTGDPDGTTEARDKISDSPAVIEKKKIKGAIRTDFILSAEIIVIALGTVASEPFQKQFAVLSAVAMLMTVGVYGLVAGIIKLDDAGLFLSLRPGNQPARRLQRAFGRLLLTSAPYLMKTLSVAGTAAMFMVGGGILTHGIPALHHGIEHIGELLSATPFIGPVLGFLGSGTCNAVFGIAAGAAILLLIHGLKKLQRKAS